MFLLLVDQEFITAKDLQATMEGLPVATDLVNCFSADTLLKIAEKINPDLVIVDFALAGEDIEGLFSALRQKSSQAHLMALLEAGDYERLNKVIEKGLLDDFLLKPIAKEDFMARIQMAGQRIRAQQKIAAKDPVQVTEPPQFITEETPVSPVPKEVLTKDTLTEEDMEELFLAEEIKEDVVSEEPLEEALEEEPEMVLPEAEEEDLDFSLPEDFSLPAAEEELSLEETLGEEKAPEVEEAPEETLDEEEFFFGEEEEQFLKTEPGAAPAEEDAEDLSFDDFADFEEDLFDGETEIPELALDEEIATETEEVVETIEEVAEEEAAEEEPIQEEDPAGLEFAVPQEADKEEVITDLSPKDSWLTTEEPVLPAAEEEALLGEEDLKEEADLFADQAGLSDLESLQPKTSFDSLFDDEPAEELFSEEEPGLVEQAREEEEAEASEDLIFPPSLPPAGLEPEFTPGTTPDLEPEPKHEPAPEPDLFSSGDDYTAPAEDLFAAEPGEPLAKETPQDQQLQEDQEEDLVAGLFTAAEESLFDEPGEPFDAEPSGLQEEPPPAFSELADATDLPDEQFFDDLLGADIFSEAPAESLEVPISTEEIPPALEELSFDEPFEEPTQSKASPLPGPSADEFLFGDAEEADYSQVPETVKRYVVERENGAAPDAAPSVEAQPVEAQAVPVKRRAEVSKEKKGGAKKIFNILGNVVFVILLLTMALLSFFLIQSKLTGGAPKVAGYQMYIVLSGSMSPAFDTGSLAFVKETRPEEVVVGDIITFNTQADPDTLTTHRVVEVLRDGELSFVTRGDANNANDPNPVPADHLVGRVTGSVPYVGYLLSFVQTRLGLILLIFVPGALIIIYELVKIIKYLNEGGKGQKGKKNGQAPAVDQYE